MLPSPFLTMSKCVSLGCPPLVALPQAKRDLANTKNDMDTLIFTTEKNLREYDDKISEEVKTEVNEALEKAQSLKDSEDLDAIKAAHEQLSGASLKIGEAIYGNKGDAPPEDAQEAQYEEKTEEEEKKKKDDEDKK